MESSSLCWEPSGCGKSTLLKAIAGIVPLTSGQIILGEQDLTKLPIHKRGAVIVFQEMRDLVRQLHRDFAMTTILVTHDRQEALSISDRVAVMFEGEIVQCDEPQIVYDQPATEQVARYFGK